MAKDEIKEIWDLDKEKLEKTLDIRPVFNLGKDFPYNKPVDLEFLESSPKEVETPNSTYKDKSLVIAVNDIVTGMEYSLFLSSVSLRMGVAKVWLKNEKDLTGIRVRIAKGRAIYKKWGENDCYSVQQITDKTPPSELNEFHN